jgi:hypothetical protein
MQVRETSRLCQFPPAARDDRDALVSDKRVHDQLPTS